MNNQSTDAQEIDLGKVFNNFSNSIKNTIFKSLSFFVKNKIVVLSILILGFGLGLYLDTKPSYKHEVILKPNFNTVDYLYPKIDQFNTYKKLEKNNILADKYQLKKRDAFGKFEILAITDIYRFLNDNESGYNFLKLMAEDGSIKKIIEESVTSKNYEYHIVIFKSSEILTHDEVVKPFMAFINDDDYLKKLHEVNVKNLKKKITSNDSIIKQIDHVFKKFGTQDSSSSLSISSENVPLDNLLHIKDKLINHNNYMELSLMQSSDIIKEHTTILNVKDTKGMTGKIKFILPLLFILLFVISNSIINFYKKNKEKLNA